MGDEVRRLVDQLVAGTDVLVGGPTAAASRLLAAAGDALAGQASLVRVTSTGELSLSSLIAQLAEHADLGGQDDAVLELGFKRLTGAGRTILLLQVPQGVSRTALRYVQHVSRQAPRLNLAVLASPALDTLLEEPGFIAMRTRLRAAVPIDAPMPASQPAVATVSATTPRARPLLWAVSAIAVAAAIVGLAWVGQSSLRAQEDSRSRAGSAMPAVAATIPAPPLPVASSSPAAVPSTSPMLAGAVLPKLAAPPRIPLATVTLPPLLAPTQTLAAVDRLPPLRRPEPVRTARVRQTWPSPRNVYPDPAGYADAYGYDDPPPMWLRPRYGRDFRQREAFYPYATDIYGRPIFRDDR